MQKKLIGNSADLESFGVALAADSTHKQKKGGGGDSGGEAEGADGAKKMAKKGEAIKEDVDALLDEIDEVLEENAEEFVKNYVQRGGE